VTSDINENEVVKKFTREENQVESGIRIAT
jgi:hypothetical protein